MYLISSVQEYLLLRKCGIDVEKLPFDYCKLTRFKDTSNTTYVCICRNHQCNFYNPKCQIKTTDYTFEKKGIDGNVEEYHAAFGTDPKEFYEYMLKIHNITTTTSNDTLPITSPIPIVCMASNCTIQSLAYSFKRDEKLLLCIIFGNLLCIMKYKIVS